MIYLKISLVVTIISILSWNWFSVKKALKKGSPSIFDLIGNFFIISIVVLIHSLIITTLVIPNS